MKSSILHFAKTILYCGRLLEGNGEKVRTGTTIYRRQNDVFPRTMVRREETIIKIFGK